MKILNFKHKGRQVTGFLCTPIEYEQAVRDYGNGHVIPWLHRAFTSGSRTWLRADAWELEGLAAHELGHHEGLDHPASILPWLAWAVLRGFPTMGPGLRLRDPEGLRPAARKWLQELS